MNWLSEWAVSLRHILRYLEPYRGMVDLHKKGYLINIYLIKAI